MKHLKMKKLLALILVVAMQLSLVTPAMAGETTNAAVPTKTVQETVLQSETDAQTTEKESQTEKETQVQTESQTQTETQVETESQTQTETQSEIESQTEETQKKEDVQTQEKPQKETETQSEDKVEADSVEESAQTFALERDVENKVLEVEAGTKVAFSDITHLDYDTENVLSYKLENVADTSKTYTIQKPLGSWNDTSLSVPIGEYNVYKGVWKIVTTTYTLLSPRLEVKNYYPLTVNISGGTGTVKINNTSVSDAEMYKVSTSDTTLTVTIEPDAGYSISSVKLGEGSPITSEADGSYKVTVTKKSDLNVEFSAISGSKVKLGAVEHVKEVNVNGDACTSDGIGVLKEGKVAVAVTPEDGWSIANVTITKEAKGTDSEAALELIPTYANYVAAIEMSDPGEDNVYRVDVETVETKVAVNETPEISYAKVNAGKDALIEEILDKVVDFNQSVPTDMTKTDLKVEYYAGSIISLEQWKEIDANASYPLHKFGANGADSTEKVRITYSGNDQFRSAVSEVTVTLKDLRLDSQIKVHDADIDMAKVSDGKDELTQEILSKVVDLGESVPSDIQFADLKVEYYATSVINGLGSWSELGVTPLLCKAFGAGGEDSTEIVRITYQGNDDYRDTTSEEVTVTLKDLRPECEIQLSSNIVTDVTYGDTEGLDARILALVTSVTGEKGETENWQDKLSVSPSMEKADAGTYTVTISFAGDKVYKPGSVEVTVVVQKKSASINVTNKSITYTGDSCAIEGMISTNPSGVDHVTVVAGIDGDGKGYISILMPQSVKDKLKVGPVDVYSILQGWVKDGIELNQLSGIMSDLSKVIEDLKKTGIDLGVDLTGIVEVMQYVEKIMVDSGISSKLNAKIYLDGNPSAAGIYLIGTGITDSNYTTDVSIGYLTIGPKTAEMKLQFDYEIPYSVADVAYIMSYEDNQTFDFGVSLYDGTDQIDAATASKNIKVVYAGASFAGKAYLSSTRPTEPGTYTQTAMTIGGNYLAAPVSRLYTVRRIKADIQFADVSTMAYNGAAQAPGVGLYEAVSGNEITDATLQIAYKNLDTKEVFTDAPINLGKYEMKVTFMGDGRYQFVGTKYKKFDIVPKNVDVTITGPDTVAYGDAYTHAASYEVVGSDTADVTVLYDGSETVPTACGDYTLTVRINDSKYALANLEGTKTLTIEPRKVDVTITGPDTVTYGDAYTHSASYEIVGSDTADVTVLYDGSEAVPTDCGEYALTVRINDSKYALANLEGTKTFKIEPKKVAVSISGPATVVYGDAYTHTASYTDINGQKVNTPVLYGGVNTVASNAGNYVLTSMIQDQNYELDKTEGVTAFTITCRKLAWDTTNLSAEKKFDGKNAVEVEGDLSVTNIVEGDNVDFTYTSLTGTYDSMQNKTGNYTVTIQVNGVAVNANYELPETKPQIEGKITAVPALETGKKEGLIFAVLINDTIPEEVWSSLNYSSESGIRLAMKTAVKDYLKNATVNNNSIFDLTLLVSADNGVTWRQATKEELKNGITVYLPYPDDTNKKDYEFAVAHMKSNGRSEKMKVEETDKGLKVTFHSFSPVAVGFKEIVKASNTSTKTNSTSPGTGDTSNVYLWIGMMVLSIIVGAVVIIRRRRTTK